MQRVLTFVSILGITISAHAANLVQNPEFIQPDNFASPTNKFLGFQGNGATLGPWNITTTFLLDYFRGNPVNGGPASITPNPSADGYWVSLTDQDFNPGHITTISQDLGLLASLGQIYHLSFIQGTNGNTGDVFFKVYPTLGTTALTLAGTPVFTSEFTDPVSPGNWVTQTANFTLPVDGAYTIGFTNKAGFSGLVDSVTIVPEPSALILMVMGGAGAFLVTRRRTQG